MQKIQKSALSCKDFSASGPAKCVWRAAYGASGVQAQLPPEVVFINRDEVHVFFCRLFFKLFIHVVPDDYGNNNEKVLASPFWGGNFFGNSQITSLLTKFDKHMQRA